MYICSALQKVLDAAVLTDLLFQPALLSSLRLINSSIATRARSSPLLIKLLFAARHTSVARCYDEQTVFILDHMLNVGATDTGRQCAAELISGFLQVHVSFSFTQQIAEEEEMTLSC